MFAEMNENLSLMILDMIFVFGSGSMRGTFQQEMEPVSDKYPLCRTQQLMLCVALALTRQVLYKLSVDFKELKRM
jgi:hypothetical protein